MTERSDPDLLDQAQRAAVFARLVQAEHLSEGDAEEWLARWEAEARSIGRERGSSGYWDAAWRWIEDQRRGTKWDMDARGADGQVHGG